MDIVNIEYETMVRHKKISDKPSLKRKGLTASAASPSKKLGWRDWVVPGLMILGVTLATLVVTQAIMPTRNAYAITCPDGSTRPDADAANCPTAGFPTAENSPNGIISGSSEDDCKGNEIKAGVPETDESHCAIVDDILLLTNALSALVAVVIVASIIAGGIQYASAADDPAKIQAAKQRITNAIIALFIFIFMFAFLQYLVPGGIF